MFQYTSQTNKESTKKPNDIPEKPGIDRGVILRASENALQQGLTPAQMFVDEEKEEILQKKKSITQIKRGHHINSDPFLENEANVMGARAAQGVSVQVSGAGSGIQKQEANSFTVPQGWGLVQIARHLGVTIEALKESNQDKLKTWGTVQGFNMGEIITVPSTTQEPEKTPEELINGYLNDFKQGKLIMPEFARLLIPFAEKQGNIISAIFLKINPVSWDNFAYAMANNATDTQLARFDRQLLQQLSLALRSMLLKPNSLVFNLEQKRRIDYILNIEKNAKTTSLRTIMGDSDKTEMEKAKEIIQNIRNLIAEYPPKIKAFKAQSNITENKKQEVLGRVAAYVGRLEVLMGSVFYMGSDSGNTWETLGSNKGDDEFLKYYQTDQHGVTNQGAEWCAMFVASILSEALGFAPVDEEGYRASQKGYGWVTWNVTSLHDSITNHAPNYSYDTRHSKKITNANFNTLRQQIVNELDQQKRYVLVKTFFSNHFTPQAGDLLAVGTKTALGQGSVSSGLTGFNHSTMIEQLIDKASEHKIYLSTIEGNADQRAGGRLIDLTVSTNNSQDDLSFVTQVSRVGLSNYGVGTNINDATFDSELLSNSSQVWSEADLVEPLKDFSIILQNYAAEKGYIQQSNYNESVAQIIQEDVAGSIN